MTGAAFDSCMSHCGAAGSRNKPEGFKPQGKIVSSSQASVPEKAENVLIRSSFEFEIN